MRNHHTDIKIQIIDELDGFIRLENIWNKLLRYSHFNSVFLTYQWFSSFINSFGLVDRLFIIVIYVKNDAVGILPFYRDEYEFFRIRFHVLRSITNVHTPKFDFIIRPGYEYLIEKALLRSIEIYSWDLIHLDYVIEGSYLLNKCRSGAQKPFRFKAAEKLKSPHLIINCNWSDYWDNRIKKSLRRNITRLEKQANEKHGIAFEHISGDLLRLEDLKEAFLIEDSGWKGKAGTSILKNHDAEKFYRELAFTMNSLYGFELFFLSLGGKRVAFSYCLKRDSNIYSLKVGYDEEYRRYGLGSILQKMFLQYIFMNQYQKFDLLGSMDPNKLKWTNGIDILYSIYIFNRKVKSHILKFFMFDATELASKLGVKGFLTDCYLKIKGISKSK